MKLNVFFENYVSNTIAGSGSQYHFEPVDSAVFGKGRIHYRVTAGGCCKYSFLFSNTMDSTFSDGSVSRKNQFIGAWKLKDMCASNPRTGEKRLVLFDGATQKEVGPGEMFASDPVELTFENGDELLIEFSFAGESMPNHEESIILSEVLENGEWTISKRLPFPSMIGCDRKVNKKVAFFGDSITQGIGTEYNKYLNWVAKLAEVLPKENAYWNLGLGYARADDGASNGVWLGKAKQNDYVCVCLGVNDLHRSFTPDDICESLKRITLLLHEAGCRVLVQTVPPFDYSEALRPAWMKINEYILNVLSKEADAVFDTVPVLGKADTPWMAAFGGHPNAEGCAKWANVLKPVFERFLELKPLK